ncbi:unnamed protein product, partial [Urochloa humidicola]
AGLGEADPVVAVDGRRAAAFFIAIVFVAFSQGRGRAIGHRLAALAATGTPLHSTRKSWSLNAMDHNSWMYRFNIWIVVCRIPISYSAVGWWWRTHIRCSSDDGDFPSILEYIEALKAMPCSYAECGNKTSAEKNS